MTPTLLPSRMLRLFGEGASGLRRCLEHMGPWSVPDLIFGLKHVHARHESGDISDNIPGQEVLPSVCPETFQYLYRECFLACAAYYIPDVSKIASEARLEGHFEILRVHQATDRCKPAFFVMKDDDAKLVRVVVRGTNDINDILTDIEGHWKDIDGGFAHSGVLESAEWLLDQTEPLLLNIQASEECVRHNCRFLRIMSRVLSSRSASMLFHEHTPAVAKGSAKTRLKPGAWCSITSHEMQT